MPLGDTLGLPWQRDDIGRSLDRWSARGRRMPYGMDEMQFREYMRRLQARPDQQGTILREMRLGPGGQSRFFGTGNRPPPSPFGVPEVRRASDGFDELRLGSPEFTVPPLSTREPPSQPPDLRNPMVGGPPHTLSAYGNPFPDPTVVPNPLPDTTPGGDWEYATQPPRPPPNIEVPLPITPPNPDAIVEGATRAHLERQAAEAAQPSYFDRLFSNPAFLTGMQVLTTPPGQNPNLAQTMMAASRNQRETRNRSNMDRIWAQAFPNGQPNMEHPLLTGQSRAVAAMVHALGPETALPLLARSAMERRQLELKDIGGTPYLFDPRTGRVEQVPGSQGRAPPGFRWAEGQPGRLEPIPGGPGEHIASEVAGRLAMIRTARPQMEEVRRFFTRQWGVGETARNAVGGSVVAPEYDRARRVVRLAIEGSLRAMTGAAAPQSEVDQYMGMFMPSVVDPPETARQKLDLLERFMTNAEEIVTRGRRSGNTTTGGQDRVRTYNPQTNQLE